MANIGGGFPDGSMSQQDLGRPTAKGDSDRERGRLTAQADANRAAREAGYKSPFRRLLDRLRPHREEPGSGPQGNDGTPDKQGS
jgi:hypothetical protein